ncbi:MAG TPA: glycosyltransferase family 2 protein [Cytophagaceae bacterium]
MSTLPHLFSIVIPVYNSTSSLTELVDRIDKVFSQLDAAYEIIFVDDGSSNKATWPVIEKLAMQKPSVKGVQLTRNFGKPGALMCGLEQAAGDYIITMDDDLQHLPEDLPALIAKKEHDIVIAYFKDKKHSFQKQVFSKINSWFEEKLIGKPAHIKSGPFRLLKREIVANMLSVKTAYPSISALMYFVSKDVVMAEVSHGERKFDKSGFTFKKMLGTFSNLLINNSSFLLQVMAGMGIGISTLSFIMAIAFLIKKLTVGTTVAGWASLMIVILFIGGLILFSLGVVGEYLIRIINGVENKPSYLIRKKV